MRYLKYIVVAALIFFSGSIILLRAQKHYSEGDKLTRGNRLISVNSEPGKMLFQPDRLFNEPEITADGKMAEPEWLEASVITPFKNNKGISEPTSVRVLFDKENIYLFWKVNEEDGITASAADDDSVITGDDYVQIDLKPWLPDRIKHARDYYYSIAVSPEGVVWDAYFDPYLDGFFFSSWNSNSTTAVIRDNHTWSAEMIIPYSGLDLYSDPGWKWNLEFFHSSVIKPGQTDITASDIGVTVEQGIRVRRAGLVSYYWPRPDFMQEIKPDMSLKKHMVLDAVFLESEPRINSRLDRGIWDSVQKDEIQFDDRTGEVLTAHKARAGIGITSEYLCLNLEADGAKIEKTVDSASALGEGMAAQMSGVNGVFVDRAVFEKECFWIILQPQTKGDDQIHQDYYHIIVDNQGRIRGTHYNSYGVPYHDWIPAAEVDLFNTSGGWGAEVSIALSSFDIPCSYADNWGLNIFRNRLLEDGKYELQAWCYTANDYLNPETFGRLAEIPEIKQDVVTAGIRRKLLETADRMAAVPAGYQTELKDMKVLADEIQLGTAAELERAEQILPRIDRAIGLIDSAEYYKSIPHPVQGGYPLMDVQFIGRKGWAVGAMGTILRTEDGGETWEDVPLQSDSDLYRVDFVDEQRGWAAGGRIRIAATNESMRHDKRGGFGYIYHTADGGKTWQCQYGERGRLLFGLDFVDINTGYACGERGFLLKTEDGGVNWKEMRTTGTMNWLYGMTFKDRITGFAVGLRETVIKTSDGGRSWAEVAAPADRRPYGFQPIYRDITFNGNTGCIVGQNGSLLMSHDGGESWSPAATFFKSEIRDLMDLRRVKFTSPLQGYAVGELGTQLMVTEDGGKSWSYRPLPDTEWLRAVWADSSGKVVLTGEREKVMISKDRGYTWDKARGKRPKADILVLLAHGDDAPINLNALFAHYCINQDKTIVEVGVMSDTHSSEYEETYNLEHDRNMWMAGVRTTSNFNEFETGNNGSDYYHFTERLWEGEGNVTRHMVAAIRAYRPDIVITHGGVFGDYDKPGHKLSGRAGLPAFESAGGEVDLWPELTRLGLEPWQPQKLYVLASESYPVTLELSSIAAEPLKGTDGTCLEFGEYVIRNFQSQGVYHARIGKLSLVKSLVKVPEKEISVFDGLE
jgi:photosystem II stability/assembly factor-like uncharacterized protein